ncbi:hypothetical protein DFH11DRAFT_1014743 [Phellopilus nigrolimitatus]|nr:hypothetical protein DFH11DRAFT_1014743 [Phellopilus nigrolimitatus]
MTVKDLAELSMKHGLVCQNVSAAAQAITFFIRTHLARCEAEQDFPLVLRLVMYGTSKDDSIAAGLYSRTAGNTGNKDKPSKDENGKTDVDRRTCFRRGSTVWYLSKAAGAPCPFARAGIALRDFCEVSGITGAESRKGTGFGGDCRGIKRKRERGGLRYRSTSGTTARCEDDEDSAEGRRPPKVKLTLRLRPCLTSMREKTELEEEESSSSSDSDSDSEVEEIPMAVDSTEPTAASPDREHSVRERESTWTFPPFPIQRRISIPPYTPSEETYPSIFTSPSSQLPASASFADWPEPPKPKLELTCVDSSVRAGSAAPGIGPYYHRSGGMPYNVSTPPPESDDEFAFGDDEDDDFSLSMSPVIPIKREDGPLAYVWPQAAPSVTSLDFEYVKSEPAFDDSYGLSGSKRSSTQTVKQEKHEELDFGLEALSLSLNDDTVVDSLPLGLGLGIKPEEDSELVPGADDGFVWDQPIDLAHEEPVCNLDAREVANTSDRTGSNAALQLEWKDVELLGPDTVRLQELEDGGWENIRVHLEVAASPSSTSVKRTPLEQHDEDLRAATSQSPETSMHTSLRRSFSPVLDTDMLPALYFGSLSSPPSLVGSVQTWSACSPETEFESVGPASPPVYYGPDSPAAVRDDEPTSLTSADVYDISRSAPWAIPGKVPVPPSVPSRRAPRADFSDIALSDASAPWERGMVSQEDVEEHLLAPAPVAAMRALNMSSIAKASPFENVAPELPLSPQEEAVFQSLCMCPDMEWDSPTQPRQQNSNQAQSVVDTVTVAEKVAKAIQAGMPAPEASFADVFAAATRPSAALRGKRGGKRHSIEKEQVLSRRRASVEEDAEEDNDDMETDADTESRTGSRHVSHSREKSGGPAPLRRSKRVANAVATQRKRERLRKRTTT